MRSEIDGATGKRAKLRLLRRYGWGVPSEATVLTSTRQAVTTVTQDDFVPFDEKHKARRFRLHRLPWPVETLRDLGAGDVALRVTLSYFIEPVASRRGWRQRYTYSSHGLRFELKLPTGTIDAFITRVNREAQLEEDRNRQSSRSGQDRWQIGPNQRNLGSLHQDIWEGSGADLADMGAIAVYPVGGWWKNNNRKDRASRKTRYSLLIRFHVLLSLKQRFSGHVARSRSPLGVKLVPVDVDRLEVGVADFDLVGVGPSSSWAWTSRPVVVVVAAAAIRLMIVSREASGLPFYTP